MEQIVNYLSYPFVQNALIIGILVSLCASLLGVSLVLKRYSFIGDGLSHVAFGAMAIATVMNLVSDMIVIMPVTVLAAVLLLRVGQNTKIKGDSAIAMISVSSMAIGYFLLSLFSKSANVSGDVCSTLFGSTSILTLTEKDVALCVGMSVVVLVIFLLFYHRIFAVTFDENFARATGVPAGMCNLILATVTAVIIVLAMKLVGTLLISALIIFPALSAMQVWKSFRKVLVTSAILSVFCSFVGIIGSILLEAPVGATIVITDLVMFFIFAFIGKMKNI